MAHKLSRLESILCLQRLHTRSPVRNIHKNNFSARIFALPIEYWVFVCVCEREGVGVGFVPCTSPYAHFYLDSNISSSTRTYILCIPVILFLLLFVQLLSFRWLLRFTLFSIAYIAIHFSLSINLYVNYVCILITCARFCPYFQRNTKFITLIWLSFIFVQNKCFEIFFSFFLPPTQKPKKKETRRKILYISFYWLCNFLIQRHTQRPAKKENENLIRKRSGKDFLFPFLPHFLLFTTRS